MIGGLLQWWYIGGWKIFVTGLGERLRNSADFFSIGLLFKTLFSPFRQISAEKVDGSIDAKFHALMDRLFSRIMGAIVRIFIIMMGIIVLIVQAIVGALLALLWPFVPIMPIVCLALMALGVVF